MLSLKNLLARPGDVLGTWSQLASPEVIEMLGSAGFDFTVIDCEHASFGLETAEGMVRACKAAGIAALLRVPVNDRSWIGRALDTGATGIVVPAIETGGDASRAVAAARFAPRGTRGSCPCVRSAGHSTQDWPAYEEEQEAEHGILALVETRKGVERIEEICSAPGLAAVVAGPFDLSVSLGHRGDVLHGEVVAGLDRIVRATAAAGVPLFMPVFSTDLGAGRSQVEAWRAARVSRFLIGTDKILISEQLRRYRQVIASE